MLAFCAYQELLPFAAGAGFYTLVGATGAGHVGARGRDRPRRRRRKRTARRALVYGVAGGLVLLPIALGETLARIDYTAHARRARAVDHRRAERATARARAPTPRSSTALVAGGDIPAIPKPEIGFRMLTDQEFVYQNFGDSYLLEFSAPRWIQCAYNPPYVDEEAEPGGEAEMADDGAGEGEWSCPSKPPELW